MYYINSKKNSHKRNFSKTKFYSCCTAVAAAEPSRENVVQAFVIPYITCPGSDIGRAREMRKRTEEKENDRLVIISQHPPTEVNVPWRAVSGWGARFTFTLHSLCRLLPCNGWASRPTAAGAFSRRAAAWRSTKFLIDPDKKIIKISVLSFFLICSILCQNCCGLFSRKKL